MRDKGGERETEGKGRNILNGERKIMGIGSKERERECSENQENTTRQYLTSNICLV